MERDPRITTRLEAGKKVLDEINTLQHRGTHASFHWETSATATRLQGAMASLYKSRDDELDSNNDLDLFDREIARAKDEVRFATRLLDENGPDVKWPR